jgi:hypothetical protein
VAVPVKFVAGVKVTSPVVGLTLHWLPLASVKDICWPAVEGSRSMVLTKMLLPAPNALSLAVILLRVTGVLKGVVPLSSRAIGGFGRLVGVFVGVFVGVWVGVFEAVGVDVLVGVSVGVLVGVLVGVSVGVFDGVALGVFVGVLLGVGVFVGVFVGVLVGVLVGVSVGVDVGVRTVTVSEPVLLLSLTSGTLLSGSTITVLGRLPAAEAVTGNVMLNEALAGKVTVPLATQARVVPVIEQLIVPVGAVVPFVTVSAPCG